MASYKEKGPFDRFDSSSAIEESRTSGMEISPDNSQVLVSEQYETMLALSKTQTRKSHTRKASLEVEVHQSGANEVWWDGPNDPANPRNWSTLVKGGNIFLIANLCFVVPLASSIFAPGIPELMDEFGSTSSSLSTFVLSIYVLGFGIGPLLWAPMSEIYGRLPIYHISGMLFVLCTSACALSTNLSMLITFRFLAGCMGSAPMTNGGGTIADMIPQEKRGAAMSIVTLGPLLGPVFGPVIGGFLVQAKGWRWPFWLVVILSGITWGISLICLRETYSIVLLEKKTKKLRKETNNMDLRSKLDTGASAKDILWKSIVRPLKMLVYSPIIFGLSLYIGIIYGYLYLLFSTFVLVFQGQYGFSTATVGLAYLGLGIGNIIGLVLFGLFSDRMLQAGIKHGDDGSEIPIKPEARLPPMIPGAILIPIGFFIYGWTAERKTHWIVPIFGTLLFGVGNLVATMPIITYIVDAYPLYAASALAASTLIRGIAGAFLPLGAPQMYHKLGLGWGNSLLGFVALAMIPVPLFFYRYGERFRAMLKAEHL